MSQAEEELYRLAKGMMTRSQFREAMTRPQFREAIEGAAYHDSASVSSKDVEELLKRRDAYERPYSFMPGDIVKWKEGMCNQELSGPFVVMSVGNQVTDNMRVGYINYNDAFVFDYLDQKRLEPVMLPVKEAEDGKARS